MTDIADVLTDKFNNPPDALKGYSIVPNLNVVTHALYVTVFIINENVKLLFVSLIVFTLFKSNIKSVADVKPSKYNIEPFV